MPGFFQEKNQISAPLKKTADDTPEGWASFESARESQAAIPSAADPDKAKFNYLPPGMEIDNQRSMESPDFPLNMAGETDVSKDTNPEAFREGFKRIDMKGTDDLYTGEHTDLFYSDAGGFCERNNYLDRS